MGKIHAMMDIGKRAMMNSQSALQTVAHNVANKTTEGYSRQRVEQVTAPPIIEGNLQMGQGARAAQVTRISNPFLEKQLAGATGKAGFMEAQAESLSRVEQVFNEQQNKSLNQYVADFFNSFRELSNNPESTTVRTIVKETGEAMAKDFSRVDKQLETIQKDIDFQISAKVGEINRYTKEVAELNKQIAEVEIQGIQANDQRDRREMLVKKINQAIDVKVAEGENGMINISTAGNALLVTGFDSLELKTYQNEKDRMEVYARISDSHPDIRITDRIKGGAIGGLVQVRDQTCDELRNQMDLLAFVIHGEVNDAHGMGYDRVGREGGEFFKGMENIAGASRNIQLSQDIAEDTTRIAAAARPNAPGDNTTAAVISRIQYRGIMEGGQSTIDDFYNSQVGRIGVMTAQSQRTKESQDNIVNQLSTLRESVSGVSLDEEAAKMIEFQKAFDASARLIRTADEMFDTVLSLKRL